MIRLEQIKQYYPPSIRENPVFSKYMLKEYVQLMILEYLSTTRYATKLSFIGGTALRLIRGIDRFSEDLDFDCKDLSYDDFLLLSDDVVRHLRLSGLKVEPKDKESDKLLAYRRSIYFPELLFSLGLSGYKEERFLVKLECQDQGYEYVPRAVNIRRSGFFFPVLTPPDSVLCSMKISALLSRGKGRDFYDAMFLLSLVEPDYGYLAAKCGIIDREHLKESLLAAVTQTDLKHKSRDFEHLLLNKSDNLKILRFREFVEGL